MQPDPIVVPGAHHVNGHRMAPPFPAQMQLAVVAMGCFWGAEKDFWELPGVYSTAVGYMGGTTANPSYRQVCSGRTGHAEAVLVVFDPGVLDYLGVLREFWEKHDPTQGMRQGNDRGSQYRSVIFALDEEQARSARATAAGYGPRLAAGGYGPITTQIVAVEPPPQPYPQAVPPGFYYAEDYHQQYLAKNPGGYCPVHATGIQCPADMQA